jgi:hypothetical protein
MSFLSIQASVFRLSAIIVAFGLLAVPSWAATRSFDYPPQAATVGNGSNASLNINLPNSGNPFFFITFVLPRDYDPDRTVSIVLYLQSPVAPCTTRIIPAQLIRKRVGAPLINDITGLSGGPTFGLQAGLVAGATFKLKPGGPLAGQRPGDAFTVQFTREADSSTDTCNGPVFVQAIDIRYPIP